MTTRRRFPHAIIRVLRLQFPLRLPLVKRVRRYLGQQSEILGLRPRPKLASRRLVLLLRIFVVDIGAYGIEPSVNGDFDHHLFSELSLFPYVCNCPSRLF